MAEAHRLRSATDRFKMDYEEWHVHCDSAALRNQAERARMNQRNLKIVKKDGGEDGPKADASPARRPSDRPMSVDPSRRARQWTPGSGVVHRVPRPSDWPADGPVDLKVHDLPHASATTEWWYVNGHVVTVGGRKFSFFAAFFRQAMGRNRETLAYEYAHSVTWALIDVDRKKYFHNTGVDRSAPAEGLKRMQRGLGSRDPRMNRALAEILERGHVPSPDKLFEHDVFIGEQNLELDYSGNRFVKLDDGRYRLELSDPKRGIACELVFEPRKPPTRHGDDGVVRGSDNEEMFYYFMPRCRVTGRITCAGERLAITEGQGWYDHEFGVRRDDFIDDEADALIDPAQRAKLHEERRTRREDNMIGWSWLSTMLDDGTDVSMYPLTYVKTNQPAGAWAIVVDKEGRRTLHEDLSFEPVDYWQSTQTFFDHPVRWRCQIPSAGIDLEVAAAFEDQEFITLISKPSFWEGRVDVVGMHRGKAVRGLGFVERSGFTQYEDLDGFFDCVGRVVRREVNAVMPHSPTPEHAMKLIGSENRPHYLDGVDVEQFARTMIKPLRDVVDRGGKGWRSYATLTCIDIVGGDSRNFVEWLALPEMMHVGSLIVDDVQDKSTVRRGAPTVHVLYGEGQAINSGTAAYFLAQRFFRMENISPANRLRVYDLYFEALRAGHSGQAIDLDGFHWLMPAIVESGNGNDLERRVLAVHRLKTAAPAACLARIGAVVGGGSDEQIEALGGFFEGLGLAFQIIDDVLNLRGFKRELKSKGEDVMQGKVTLPVAKAMSRLSAVERRWLWRTLESKPQDSEVVGAVIDLLESCGAIEACVDDARRLLEEGWQRLDPLVEDTLAKMMLRAFGWFVLERHY